MLQIIQDWNAHLDLTGLNEIVKNGMDTYRP